METRMQLIDDTLAALLVAAPQGFSNLAVYPLIAPAGLDPDYLVLERGSHPKELLVLGIREYRQTFFKPYRLIYRIVGQRVHVYLIVDGRRDMQGLLARRLLGA